MAVLVNNGKLFVNKHGRHGMSQARQRKQERESEKDKERERAVVGEAERTNKSLASLGVCGRATECARFLLLPPRKGGRGSTANRKLLPQLHNSGRAQLLRDWQSARQHGQQTAQSAELQEQKQTTNYDYKANNG